LLDELNGKYQAWPLHKKETATLMITNLINQSDTLFEPLIQRPRGRPPKAKKKKGTTSTARNPSRFEYAESLQKHNPSTSASVVQRSNEVTNECKYAAEILKRTHMVNCNPSRTLVSTESKLGADGDLVSDWTLYHSLAGAL
ncbi:hypothetical protein Tco_1296574, partial [Tanacetum coccineum]